MGWSRERERTTFLPGVSVLCLEDGGRGLGEGDDNSGDGRGMNRGVLAAPSTSPAGFPVAGTGETVPIAEEADREMKASSSRAGAVVRVATRRPQSRCNILGPCPDPSHP